MTAELKVYGSQPPPRARLLMFIGICLLLGVAFCLGRVTSPAHAPSAAQPMSSSLPSAEAAPPAPVTIDPGIAQSLQQNLLAWLPFEKDLLDHSDSKLTVAMTGSVKIDAGAARFNGYSWLELPHVPLAKRNFTVAFWMLPNVPGWMGLVMQNGGLSTSHYLHMQTRYGQLPYFGFYNNDLQPLAKYKLNVHTWTHLVFEYNEGRQRIHLNGRLIAERPCAAYLGEQGVTWIGRGETAWKDCDHYDGWMKDLRIYNALLTDAQIEALARQIPAMPVLPARKRYQKEKF